MNQKKFYITTTTPYVNADPHIGFALEIVAADVIARYQELLGKEVAFNTGADEHGLKIYQAAQEDGSDPQDYVDKNAEKFKDLKQLLNLSFTVFTRTSSDHHKTAVQEFWRRCDANGDIYKKLYKIKYCVGCELEKTDSELENGVCPIHPNRQLEIIEEENYFFRFSKYQKDLLELYRNNPEFVVPKAKYTEIVAFVEKGLNDFSISRLKTKLPWGIPVPGDNDQVMYVWFDALINYISALGWPEDEENFKAFWPGVQIAGKDNLRQQSAMWQAMLISAGLPNSKQILINGFISVDGQKMSKSLGNVIAPKELVEKYGVDGARYILMNLGPVGDDMDISWEKLDVTYNANLANGLGNLVSRVATLAGRGSNQFTVYSLQFTDKEFEGIRKYLDEFRFDEAMRLIWSWMAELDRQINEKKPWTLQGKELEAILQPWVNEVVKIGVALRLFLPETAEKILSQFKGPKIKSEAALFPRLS